MKKPDDIRLAALEDTARAIGHRIGDALDREYDKSVGYCLLLFTFDPGWSTYISNAEAADMIKELREAADVLEARLKESGELGPPAMPGYPADDDDLSAE